MIKALFKPLLLLSCLCLCLSLAVACGGEECTHTWDAGVTQKEATCKANGEALFTCTVCGETKTEVTTGTHTYEKDICTLCGAFNDKIKNPNLVLVDSIFSENGITVTGENVSVTYNDIIDLNLTSCGANIKVVGGLLVGEAWAHGTSHGQPFEATIEFKDGEIRFFGDSLSALINGSDATPMSSAEELPGEPYATYSQDALLRMLPLNIYSAIFEDKDNTESMGSMWDAIMQADNNIINKKLGSLMNMVFLKSQTVDEYRYKINPTLVKSLLENAKTKSISEFINIVLGKKVFENAMSFAEGALDKTVSQLETMTKTALSVYGISFDAVISLIEDIAGIEIDKQLDAIKDYKIYELINEYSDMDLALDEYQKRLAEFNALCTENTLFNLVINPILQEYLTITYDEIGEIISYLVDSSSLELTVSPGYKLIQAKEHFDGVTVNEEINGKQINLTLSGSFLLKVNK